MTVEFTRKLQQVKTSLLITLPKPWVLGQRLTKGAKLRCIVTDAGILIETVQEGLK